MLIIQRSGYNWRQAVWPFWRTARINDNQTVTGMTAASIMSNEERELAELIVTALNLESAPAEIDPEAPLYGEGLGLDSIDILEIALAVSKRYGVQIRSDDNDNVRIFSSLRTLNEHVQQQRVA